MIKKSTCNVGGLGLIPGWGRSPGGEWLLTPIFLPGEFHKQRRRAVVHWAAESDMTEKTDFFFSGEKLTIFLCSPPPPDKASKLIEFLLSISFLFKNYVNVTLVDGRVVYIRVCCEQTLLDCGILSLHIISYLGWYTCNVEIWRPDPWCAAFRITLESFRTRSLGMDWHKSKLVLYRCLSCVLNYQSYIWPIHNEGPCLIDLTALMKGDKIFVNSWNR